MQCCPLPAQAQPAPSLLRLGRHRWLGLMGSLRQPELSPAALQASGQMPAAWFEAVAGSLARRGKEGARRAAQPALQRRSAAVPEGWIAISARAAAPFGSGLTPRGPPGCCRSGPFAGPISHLFGDPAAAPIAYPWAFGKPGGLAAGANLQDLAETPRRGLVSAPGCQPFRLLVLPSSPRVW